MIRLFHTNLTRPVGISGSVSLAPAAKSGITIFPHGLKYRSVKGVRLDVAFIENNYRDCGDFKGYEYLGI